MSPNLRKYGQVCLWSNISLGNRPVKQCIHLCPCILTRSICILRRRRRLHILLHRPSISLSLYDMGTNQRATSTNSTPAPDPIGVDQSSSSPYSLLSLPNEILMNILYRVLPYTKALKAYPSYERAFCVSHVHPWSFEFGLRSLAILNTCRRLNGLGTYILYSTNKFTLRLPFLGDCVRKPARLRSPGRPMSLVRYLHIDTSVYDIELPIENSIEFCNAMQRDIKSVKSLFRDNSVLSTITVSIEDGGSAEVKEIVMKTLIEEFEGWLDVKIEKIQWHRDRIGPPLDLGFPRIPLIFPQCRRTL